MSAPSVSSGSSPLQVIPATTGPLRTFVFFEYIKKPWFNQTHTYNLQLFLAESKLAIAEWWCQGGAGAPSFTLPWDEEEDPRNERGEYPTMKLSPEQLLELMVEQAADHHNEDHYVLEEVEQQPTLIPTSTMIQTELNHYLLPELTNLIINLMRPSDYYYGRRRRRMRKNPGN